jgi:hypothetical protein
MEGIHSYRNSITVKLQVFGISGEETEILIDDNLSPGKYRVKWNADKYPSGVYFCYLFTEEYSLVKKTVLIK